MGALARLYEQAGTPVQLLGAKRESPGDLAAAGWRAAGGNNAGNGNGQRATGNGQRATGNGQRATGNGQRG